MMSARQKVVVAIEGGVQAGKTSVERYTSEGTRLPALLRCYVLHLFERFLLDNLSHEVPKCVLEYGRPKFHGLVSK